MTLRRLGILLTACVLAVSGCGGDDDSGDGGGGEDSGAAASGSADISGSKLTISTWGGSWTEATETHFGKPFSEETGVEIEYVPTSSTPTAPALLQEQSGNVTFDIVESENMLVLRERGFLTEFPQDLQDVFTETMRSDAFSPHHIQLGGSAVVIACNPALMERCPTTPAEFFDVEGFPGPRAILNRASDAIAIALLADGVAPEDLYPLDIDRAIAKLKEIKPHVDVFPSSGDEQERAMIDEEAGAALMWNGRAHIVKKETIPDLELHWDGSIVSQAGGQVILRGAPNKDAAFAYFRWIAEHPEAQAGWSEELTYSTPTKELQELLPADVAEALPFAHDPIVEDAAYINENLDELEEGWQSFLAG